MPDITPERLAEMKAKAAVIPGPLSVSDCYDGGRTVVMIRSWGRHVSLNIPDDKGAWWDNGDGTFNGDETAEAIGNAIASMINNQPDLIAALESAWAEVERLKAGKLAELCREIGDFSEESYCAGWMGGIEDDLPRLCAKVIETGRPHHYGQATVTVERAKYFTQLAADAGSWVDMDGNRYEPKVSP